MKQFQCSALGLTPYTLDNAIGIAFGGRIDEGSLSRKEASTRLEALAVGATLIDEDDDAWVRLPDLVLEDNVLLTAEDFTASRESAVRVQQAERLERIATAMMAAIVGKFPADTRSDDDRELDEQHARGAVAYALALIAELDKQS